jgi:hypothetical protein
MGLISVMATNNALAYNLEGGKFSTGPYYQKYFNDCSTYSNSISFWLAVQAGVSAWNNTQNTKVWFQNTSTQSESIMDFHTVDLGSVDTYGQTTFWNGSQPVRSDSVWYWTKTEMNTGANWTKWDNVDLSIRAKVVQEVAAHEEGHALGLAHVNVFADASKHLMYPSPQPTGFGVYGPVADDVAGVQKIYGTLY